MSMPNLRWDDPFRTGFAGSMYDPGTMYGLFYRAQAGDAAAKNHLAQNGFFDAQGNDVWGGAQNLQSAVSNWAKARNLTTYNGPSPFQWNNAWTNGNDAGFQAQWRQVYGQPGTGTPTSVSGVGGPPPTTPSGLQNGNPNNNGVGGELAYNQAANTDRYELNGRATETARDRIARWTGDNMRNYGMTQQNAYYAALARLKRDYERTGGPDSWRASGYDLSNIRALDTEAPDPRATYAPAATPQAAVWRNVGPQRWEKVAGGGAGQGWLPPTGGGAGGNGGGGTVGNAPAPATPPAATPSTGLPTGYQGQNPGASGDLTAAQRMMLSDDPNQAYRYMMQQLGYNPSAPGLLGSFLKKRFQPLLEARLAASGVADNGNYMDTVDQVINQFGQGLFQQGGDFFGNLRNIGNQAAQQGAGYLDSLQNQDQAMQYLNQLGQLRYAGSNPLIQQAMADEMQRANETYQDTSFNREGQGQNLDPFTQWLRQQARYRGIFGY